jgi:adenosylcobinamide-GDP ribazoletransferase
MILRSKCYYPLFEAMIGAFATVPYLIFPERIIASIFSTGASTWLTWCFHEGGLTDSFDGFGGGWTPQQIIRIMQDSRVGTYGMFGAVLWLIMKIHLLSVMPIELRAVTLVLGHSFGRLVSLPMVFGFNYLVFDDDPKGNLYNHFKRAQSLLTLPRMTFGFISTWTVGYALVSILTTNIDIFGLMLQLTALILVVAVIAGRYSTSIIGGVIGDFLGASICVSEVCVYLLLLLLKR